MARKKERSPAALEMDLMAVGFVVGKLVGALDWSWWWVLCPVWAQFALMPYIGLRAIFRNAERLKQEMELRWVSKYAGCFGGLDVVLCGVLRSMRPHGPRPRRVFELFAAYMITGVVGVACVVFVILALEGHLSSWVWLSAGLLSSLLAGGMVARSIGVAIEEDSARPGSTTDPSGTEEPLPH